MSTLRERMDDHEPVEAPESAPIPADGLYVTIPDDEIDGDWDPDFDLEEP